MSQRYIGGLIYNPPGGFSGYFDGSGDYLTIADNIALDMEGSDFTIEGWIFPVVSSGGSVGVFSKRASGAVVGGVLLYYNGAGLTPSLLIGSGGSWVINQASSIAFGLGQWNHFAVVRNGTSFVLYINGVAGVSATSSSSVTDNSAAFAIGAWAADGTGAISASYFSNFRVVKGTALYTAAFTPPTGPLQAITNTSLLTCAYPTFRDGSSNNFTITVNGNTAVSTQNPFPLTQLPNPALGNQGNGVYSMSQYQALRSQNLWPAIDQYWPYVTLMLHGNGTNGAQNNTFLDSSTNNFTITRNGNTTQGTFTPYGSNWANYFDGASDLRIASNAAFAPGTGDFTCEMWINPPSWAAGAPIFVVSGTGGLWIGKNGSNFVVRAYGVADQLQYGILPNTNTWTHIVAVRSGTTLSLYYNGSRVATTTNSYNFAQAAVGIGSDRDAVTPTYYTGYVSNLRLVKGTAVYDPTQATITVPANPITAITNTSLLTCQSNRFIDNSSNAFAITTTGSPSVQRFSPFNPSTPYAAGTIGGSGYFDGSGDYLVCGAASDWAFMSNSTALWSVEMWVYPTVLGSNDRTLLDTAQSTTANVGMAMTILTNRTVQVEIYRGSAGTYVVTGSSTSTLVANQWNHILATYDQSLASQNLKFYINGGSAETANKTGNAPSASNPNRAMTIATYGAGGGQFFTGYIGSMRISNVIRSSGVPTAPYTSDANTVLLTNYTNGGIIDNAMMNDLETVGNAQISTSVSKFGGGSIYLDGTANTWLQLQPSSQNFNFGTGDYTIEAWVYQTNRKTDTVPIFQTAGSNSSGLIFGLGAGDGVPPAGNLAIYSNGGFVISSTSQAVSLNTWTHVAVTRASGTTRVFINGTVVGSSTTSYNPGYSNPVVGVNSSYTPAIYQGYIDDLRITKGYARYTANFTPQRSQWQDQ